MQNFPRFNDVKYSNRLQTLELEEDKKKEEEKNDSCQNTVLVETIVAKHNFT